MPKCAPYWSMQARQEKERRRKSSGRIRQRCMCPLRSLPLLMNRELRPAWHKVASKRIVNRTSILPLWMDVPVGCIRMHMPSKTYSSRVKSAAGHLRCGREIESTRRHQHGIVKRAKRGIAGSVTLERCSRGVVREGYNCHSFIEMNYFQSLAHGPSLLGAS